MNKITINGKTITHSGRGSVCISNNKITIGGVDIEDLDTIEEKTVNIVIEGNVENIMTEDADITVNGTAGAATTKNGNITCGDVSGDATTKNGNIMRGR
ncbi:hypothetical protein [Pseudoalteromonas sp.]|uniref:hypothetical protein n=1 Tax=Pseudoalteromonas sp. TaxID=53249 RepID=UPI00262C9E1A|nr:hypothetical protein [Pseudoalteromonas sp.]MCP4588377.1 hypothetical protein [Pseudoalteromonas sp.]